MEHPIALTGLSTREAVTDGLYRGILALDSNDQALFESAWVDSPDTVFEMGGKATRGIDAIKQFLLGFIGPLVTQHSISNVRVDVKDGADTAYLTAYAIAQHYRPGEGLDPQAPRLLSGASYAVDMVKDAGDGLWKAKVFRMKTIWIEGDPSIVTPPS